MSLLNVVRTHFTAEAKAKRAEARVERAEEKERRRNVAYRSQGPMFEVLEPRMLMSTAAVPTGYVPVWEGDVNANGDLVVMLTDAEVNPGDQFYAVAEGTFVLSNNHPSGDRYADAEYYQPSVGANPWSIGGKGKPLAISGIPEWGGGYQSDHIYGAHLNLDPTYGGDLYARILDPYYADNSGSLGLTLYKQAEIDLLADSNNDGLLDAADEAVEDNYQTGFAITDSGYSPVQVTLGSGIANASPESVDVIFDYDPASLTLWTQSAGGPGQLIADEVSYDAATLGFSPGVTTTILAQATASAAHVPTAVEVTGFINGYDWTAVVSDLIHALPIEFDLDVNKDNHEKDTTTHVTLTSTAEQITDADDAEEVSVGGYLWVNDDNDHRPTSPASVLDPDILIDLEDENFADPDNDLEPIRLTVDPRAAGLNIKLTLDPDLRGHVTLWADPRKTGRIELNAQGEYRGTIASLNLGEDHLIWVEGLNGTAGAEPLTAALTLGGLFNGVEIASDTVALTVFEIAEANYADNNGLTDANHQSSILADFATDPTGQTRSGDRIFPDLHSTTDTVVRDVFSLYTNYGPAIPAGSGWELPLYGMVFDVDHYSSDAKFDGSGATRAGGDPAGHDAGNEPNDNRTGYETGWTETDDDRLARFGEAGDRYDIGLRLYKDDSDTVTHIFSNDATTVQWAGVGAAAAAATGWNAVSYFDIGEYTPGNNWRFVVGMGDSLYDAVRINDEATNGETIEYINGIALDITAPAAASDALAKSTDTLTLWRRLHVERDRMGDVDFTEGPENQRSIRKAFLSDPVGEAGGKTVHVYMDLAQQNQFQGGQIRFYQFVPGPDNDVRIGNTTTTITSSMFDAATSITTLVLSDNLPADAFYVWIADDDVASGDFVNNPQPNVSPQLPDVGLFNHEDALPAANIEYVPDDESEAASSIIEFELNSETERPYYGFDETIAAGKTLPSFPGFWAVTVVGGYQGDVTDSDDPNYERDVLDSGAYLAGISSPYWAPGYSINLIPESSGSVLIFAETIRDYVETAQANGELEITFDIMNQRTTLHEVGHLLGGQHEDLGLMMFGSSGLALDDEMFSGASLRRFTLLRNEGTSR